MKQGILAVMMLLSAAISVAEDAPKDQKAAKDTVAVMEFTGINASPSEAAVVSEFVRSAVIQSGDFIVVDKKNMDKILAEQAFQQSGCTSDECAVKLGKVLNTQKIIVGSYSMMGQTRFMNARLVDVETGKIEASAKEKGFSPNDADSASESLVAKLLGKQPPAPAQNFAETTPEEGPLGGKKAYMPGQSYRPGQGYFQLFYGMASGKIVSFTQTSLQLLSGVPIYKAKFTGNLEMTGSRAPVGFRLGSWGDIFGGDWEVSMMEFSNKKGDLKCDATFYDGTDYSSTSFTASIAEGEMVEQLISTGFNVFLHGPTKWVVQPYAGIGGQVGVDRVSSKVTKTPNLEFLSETGFEFGVKFPVGVRFKLADWFYLFGEYQPGSWWAYYSTTKFTKTTKFNDNYSVNYQANYSTATFGAGFTY